MAWVAPDATIGRGTQLGRWVSIGRRATIGDGAIIGDRVTIHAGSHIGEGCRVGEGSVIGREPSLAPSSTVEPRELSATDIGPNCLIGAGVLVFTGACLAGGCLIGELAVVREACRIGPDTVIGCRATVENDTIIGARCKIQTGAYITAYTTIEDDVFVAPMVTTTNDNFMGRTEERLRLKRGPTIRRGARVGAAAVLLPGVVIGEEAFVAAGTIVTRDVPPRALVMGAPARVVRQVPERELLPANRPAPGRALGGADAAGGKGS